MPQEVEVAYGLPETGAAQPAQEPEQGGLKSARVARLAHADAVSAGLRPTRGALAVNGRGCALFERRA
jgi:hypothetical protein